MKNQFSAPNAANIEYARLMDQNDPIRGYQSRFLFPKKPDGTKKIYFNGNSLGLQPKSVRNYVERILNEWETLGVKGHFEGANPWIPLHEKLAIPMAQLVGAMPHEVIIMNTLTINLHLMMASFYQPRLGRSKILMESDVFPSDRYAVESQIRLHGLDPKDEIIYILPNSETGLIDENTIRSKIAEKGDEIALILFGVPNYYTGQALNMKNIVKLGHAKGCKVGFNLAHGAGNLVLSLHEDGPDFALWCTYKYMNAGPGNLSGCFIHERYANRPDINRLSGWWGQKHETRFDMRQDFDPMFGANGWCVSNAPILPMGALEASLAIFTEVGMEKLRRKSEQLTGYLEFLLQNLQNDNIEIITPSSSNERGCQLSILIKNSSTDLYDRMTNEGIITDWRKPDVIRAAPTPLYNTFEEVWTFVNTLKRILEGR